MDGIFIAPLTLFHALSLILKLDFPTLLKSLPGKRPSEQHKNDGIGLKKAPHPPSLRKADMGPTQEPLALRLPLHFKAKIKTSPSGGPNLEYLASLCLAVVEYLVLRIYSVCSSSMGSWKRPIHALTTSLDFPWESLGNAQVVDVGGGVGMFYPTPIRRQEN